MTTATDEQQTVSNALKHERQLWANIQRYQSQGRDVQYLEKQLLRVQLPRRRRLRELIAVSQRDLTLITPRGDDGWRAMNERGDRIGGAISALTREDARDPDEERAWLVGLAVSGGVEGFTLED